MPTAATSPRETTELQEGFDQAGGRRVGRELGVVVAGLAAMVIGPTLLVDGVRNLVGAETSQTRLSFTVVGFATGFELIVLAWSSARRGISEAVVAGVVGSYAYNATMTLGAAALVRPLRISDTAPLRGPMLIMLIALAAVLTLAARGGALHRVHGWVLLAAYPLFVAVALLGSPG